ncbi:MAG: ABC transporter permease [Actinobacteria bacterium]|nr:MAG: ABC transporter permease [Actinomycetota bacterium]
MKRISLTKISLKVAAPLAAAFFSIVVSSLAVIATKKSPGQAFSTMWEYGTQAGSLMEVVNTATPYYIAAIAIAVTFRAGLFNIGVEGQLRLGALFSCYLGAMFVLPPVLHVLAVFIVAMTFGGLWASIAAYLKVKRGVNEVISTIMLNSLAGGLSAYLLSKRFAVVEEGSNNLATKELPASAQVPDLMPLLRRLGVQDQPGGGVYGMFFVAVALGFIFWFVINRTRFGFELRATGINPLAARFSGVNSKKMTIFALVISGAIAGLSGLPEVLGQTHSYNLGFRAGIGFTAIAVALLGRNSAGGMAVSALLFGFLEVSSRALELIDIAPETYVIMQGSILLSSVIAYEVMRRFELTLQSKELAKVVSA